ncbi:baseplate J/gp47 family protein [Bradyrhizobium japonicum]|uniref:baseplate J/gp47 family protein n=1 Tax=Bradyrhizobium japonicum TaxID=375 RepID=UPI001E61A87D|nr:baseplate J/gp47 family protein [Bradyrhizobium japonicum]MCD9817665.1 baseplate J/gp47 family protein [Bradyrhizobium japonicum]MEB2672492.1 baseplate J/gp47 family protein [Bradyrhizobium japonicum]WRI91753.1 baseplate J/gp47 family protein [Bradyrhizobium japonicum]
MPWKTPTLKDVRRLTRDYVTSQLGARSLIPNSVLRIMSDAKAGLAHLVLLYIDWLAKQLLPDTAETEWLDRHGQIWLTNADGSKGRKAASYASGTVTLTGAQGIIVPVATGLASAAGVAYETTEEITIGSAPTPVDAMALTAGAVGNIDEGETITVSDAIPGVDGTATVVTMTGGVDEETDDQLRARILFRIQNPPMGGDAADYVAWALAVPGVTRAWSAPEMGPGTITVRFMMDDLRADNRGLPTHDDVLAVRAHIDRMRPVTVKDCFVEAPVPLYYSLTISGLDNDDEATRGAIQASIIAMGHSRSKPGQTMYRSWVDEAISNAVGEDHHELTFDTTPMPAPGYMPFVGTILYD